MSRPTVLYAAVLAILLASANFVSPVLGLELWQVEILKIAGGNPWQAEVTGAISGVLRYPSESLPAMRVYAISTDKSRHYMTRTRVNVSRFIIRNVPAGRYYVVAYAEEAPGAAGGWSRAVPCGLRNTCRDHSLIPITVAPGRTVTGIDVGDWYASPGSFPAEPAAGREKEAAASGVGSIRSIDFRNLRYLGGGGETLVLRDGKEVGVADSDAGKLLSVKYVDFDGDGNEEALVTIGRGTRGAGGYSEDYYVYSNPKGRLRQIFHEARQKPQAMRVSNGVITIVAPFWNTSDAGCCPSAMETTTYRWRGSRLVRVSRQLRRLP